MTGFCIVVAIYRVLSTTFFSTLSEYPRVGEMGFKI